MPGLSISGYGRGCNTLIGEFEILEIKRLKSGEIESFAANFIQRCEKEMPPLYGSIRYNSTIPVEARFSEYSAKTADFTLYLTKYNPITGEKSQPILISKDADSNWELRNLAYGGEGIEISMGENKNSAWTLAFAASLDEKFGVGTYERAERYPFHSSSVPGIEITTPEGSFSQPQGAFKVLKFVRGGDGEIQSLALNFQVKNSQGEILEGAVHFKSKIPVSLEKPNSSICRFLIRAQTQVRVFSLE